MLHFLVVYSVILLIIGPTSAITIENFPNSVNNVILNISLGQLLLRILRSSMFQNMTKAGARGGGVCVCVLSCLLELNLAV